MYVGLIDCHINGVIKPNALRHNIPLFRKAFSGYGTDGKQECLTEHNIILLILINHHSALDEHQFS